MSVNLIGKDITNIRKYWDEAAAMQGIPAKYQFPHMADTNTQGESVVDSYSDMYEVHIFFDGAPQVKTFKKLGWVVENDDDLPFLIRCSWDTPNLQRDSLFHLSGQYTGVEDRVFRVMEITSAIQAPDHRVAKVIPVYEKQTVGQTKKEIRKAYNKSNTFMNRPTDYRGDQLTEQDGEQ